MIDLAAYLRRIGLSGRPSVGEVHRAHALAIPFENLDPRRGIPVSLDPADLERKLVHERRGGYCFEHNLLLADALTALGARVDLLLARVRMGGDPAAGPRPRTHLALRVADGDDVWHADVGFGLGTPLCPLPFGPGDEQEFDGWRFRVAAEGEGDQLVLRTLHDASWVDLYALDPAPVPRVDCELSSWYASTFPHHPMVSGLIVAINEPDGTRVALSDWSGTLELIEHAPGRRVATAVAQSDVPRLLEERFGLDASLVGVAT